MRARSLVNHGVARPLLQKGLMQQVHEVAKMIKLSDNPPALLSAKIDQRSFLTIRDSDDDFHFTFGCKRLNSVRTWVPDAPGRVISNSTTRISGARA